MENYTSSTSSTSSMCDSYKYTLNGINHEIPLHTNLQIRQKPLSNKILISQKYLLKYIHDLFQIHSIDYFLINQSLLGIHLFKGIHIFQPFAEICIGHNHLNKFLKIKKEIEKDDFIIQELPTHFILSTSLFSKNPDTQLFIYILRNENNENNDDSQNENIYSHFLYNNQKIYHNMFDLFPLQQLPFEEFQLFTPRRIEKTLQNCSINLHLIQFIDSTPNQTQSLNKYKNNNTNTNNTKRHIIETPITSQESSTSSTSSTISSLFQMSEDIIHKIKQQFNEN